MSVERMSGRGREWDLLRGEAARGPLLTVALLIAIQLLLSVELPIATPIVSLAAVTYAAYRGGLLSGLLCALFTSLYGGYFYASPKLPPSYTFDDRVRLIMLVLTSVAIALMVGLLRRSAAAEAEDRRLSEERYHLAVAGANDGIWDWNLRNDEVYFSPRWKEMLGYEDHELPNRLTEWTGRLHPEDEERSRSAIAAYLGGATPTYELEHRLRHRDGSYRWMLARGAAVRDAAGHPVRLAGSHTDITERRRGEEEVRRSERSLAAAQRIAHLGSWEWDLGREEEWWSDEVYRILGLEPRSTTPTCQSFLAAVHPDDRERARAAVEEALRGGAPYDLDHRILLPDGSVRYVHEQAEVVARDGRPAGMRGTIHDITTRRLAEEEVERALALRGQFLAIASHELKTPVTLLKGYSQLLLRRGRKRGDAELIGPLEAIDRQANRMTRLIDDLLDVSRIESGAIRFEMRPFDLAVALEEVVEDFRTSSPAFTFVVEARPGEAWVCADRLRIQQVIVNLLSNAVRYSETARVVRAAVRRQGYRAVVEVSDEGIGIPARQQGEVFGLYFRGANVSAEHYGGLGLGLYISRSIVERHGGEIGMVSEEGAGSTFSFSLPLVEPQRTADREL